MGHEYWYYLVPIKLEGTTIEEFERNLNDYKRENLFYDDRSLYDKLSQYMFDHAPTPHDNHYTWVNTHWLDDFTYCWWDEIDEYFNPYLTKNRYVDTRRKYTVKKVDKKLKNDIKHIMEEGKDKKIEDKYAWLKILEFIIDNYGGYCYHYVY